jgi:N-acyl-D-amino-acid deacylase
VIDIIIRNGLVIDGSGAPRYRADVAIDNGRVVDVDLLENALAERTIDASGCVVTPGFVDMHSHADFSLPVNPTADSLVHQGITTTVMGQCGHSPAPLLDETRDQVIAAIQSVDIPLPWAHWSTFGSYLDFLRGMGISLNVVPLVGHGTVRSGVVGYSAARPNPEQMAKMQVEVVKAMESGAAGVSSGLIYPPGSYASTEELVDFTRPISRYKGIYFSHIRGECSTLRKAIAEAVQIGREAGVPVQISHFKVYGRDNWGTADEALDLIRQARDSGIDVTADMYPYLAGSLGLVALLPQWAQEGGKDEIFKRLGDGQARRKMTEDIMTAVFLHIDDWQDVIICDAPEHREYQGRTIAELATAASKTPHEWIYDALLENQLQLRVVEFGMCEENRELALREPFMMICTDGRGLSVEGPLSKGVPHPRNYGAFPRVLGHYVRGRKVLSLEEAVWRMSGLPSQKLGWSDRGLLKKGYWADLVVFDPDRVADTATYGAPHQYPVGIPFVLVNGNVVISQGRHTGSLAGQVL